MAGELVLGTISHFEDVILSMTGITLQTGTTLNGRALAQTAVILDANTVTKP
nr:ice-binding family protein [Reichenbachiella agariperforans]